ncbi:hypothetical protein AVEN_36470-1 [Araneus ventricosus]|uniref:Uncharacterized protein n=1 Tax=Araneus ventricosus TaxID=182803 RepID=A0A4Y2MMW5_ARAVE|nr:hypothetical protein AVEN_36470-1 [Araneus ventricosus]
MKLDAAFATSPRSYLGSAQLFVLKVLPQLGLEKDKELGCPVNSLIVVQLIGIIHFRQHAKETSLWESTHEKHLLFTKFLPPYLVFGQNESGLRFVYAVSYLGVRNCLHSKGTSPGGEKICWDVS